VLSAVISSPARDPVLQTAAALANATLRDELLAPGFLTPLLAERVRTARIAGAHVAVDVPRQGGAALTETARELLAAALADLDADGDITLQVHPAAEGDPGLLLLHVHGVRSGHLALRRGASECGALVADLGEHELLLRFQPASEPAAVHAA